MMPIQIVVTQERYDEVFSIEEWLNLSGMTNRELYDKMLNFVVDESGAPCSVEDARALFKKVPKKEWPDYVAAFLKAVNDSFVNPTNGGSSGSPPQPATPVLPDGSAS
jgi:hypothetical protein